MATEAWKMARKIRILRCWNKCEYCGKLFGKKDIIIGHHLLGREFQKEYNLEESDYCRMRHAKCERKAHDTYPHGNLPDEQIIFDNVRREYN